MSAYENDPRVTFNDDGTVVVLADVAREVPGDGWCLFRGDARVGAGFPTLDDLLGMLLGPAWA